MLALRTLIPSSDEAIVSCDLSNFRLAICFVAGYSSSLVLAMTLKRSSPCVLGCTDVAWVGFVSDDERLPTQRKRPTEKKRPSSDVGAVTQAQSLSNHKTE